MGRRGLTMLATAIIHASGLAVLAQESSSTDSEALDLLRAQTPTASDHPVIDGWIKAQVDKLQASASDPAAALSFARQFSEMYNDSRNSDAFRRTFSDRTAQVLVAAVGGGLDSIVARGFARVLLELREARGLEVMLAALRTNDPVARYLAAKALAAVKADIEADAQLSASTLRTLGEIGAAEGNGVVAAELYKAMHYPQRGDDSLKAVLVALDGRLALLEQPGTRIERAELAAIGVLEGLSDRDKAGVAQRLAKLLRICVQRYNLDDPMFRMYEQAAIEETIYQAELLLKKLTGLQRAPDVTGKFEKGGPAVRVEMEIDLNKWIGTAQDEGELNKAPWNVERGAP